MDFLNSMFYRNLARDLFIYHTISEVKKKKSEKNPEINHAWLMIKPLQTQKPTKKEIVYDVPV